MRHRAELNYSHLHALSGPYGTFEHAEIARPRVEHGYCTDDVVGSCWWRRGSPTPATT